MPSDDAHVALFARFDRVAMTFHPKEMLDWADVAADEAEAVWAGRRSGFHFS